MQRISNHKSIVSDLFCLPIGTPDLILTSMIMVFFLARLHNEEEKEIKNYVISDLELNKQYKVRISIISLEVRNGPYLNAKD